MVELFFKKKKKFQNIVMLAQIWPHFYISTDIYIYIYIYMHKLVKGLSKKSFDNFL